MIPEEIITCESKSSLQTSNDCASGEMKTNCILISEVDNACDKSNILFNFKLTTEVEVVKVLQKLPIISCVLDPIPATLFRCVTVR